MTTRSLIIGGSRNLGPDLIHALLRRGDQVTVLNRGLTASAPVPEGIERLRADRSDASALRAALFDRLFDVVVDTTLYNGADARSIVALLEGRVGRYVFWSTGQVYLVKADQRTSARAHGAYRETEYSGPIMPEPESDHDRGQWRYGVEKRDAEDALREAFEARGFPYVSLRMPMINSRRDHYGRLSGYAAAIRAGETIRAPHTQGLLRHVYGDDVITATVRATDPRVASGTCLNISQDEALRIEEMLAIVAGALGKPLRLERSDTGPFGPWSGTWMSMIDNSRSKETLGMRYTPPSVYVPKLLGLEAVRT